MKLEPARPLTKAASVAAVDNAGILKLKVLYTESIKMVFYHPKYYKELRKRNKSDQAISKEPATAGNQRSPGPGHKLQAREDIIHEENERLLDRSSKPQAASSKRQAPS